MLPKKKRLTTKLFDEVMKSGKTCHSSLFSLRILHKKDEQASRFAIVVPKKVARLAVRRNALRRKTSSALEKNITSVRPGYAGILFLKDSKKIENASMEDLKQELVLLFKQSSLLSLLQ